MPYFQELGIFFLIHNHSVVGNIVGNIVDKIFAKHQSWTGPVSFIAVSQPYNINMGPIDYLHIWFSLNVAEFEVWKSCPR